jgi:hypothetical protein
MRLILPPKLTLLKLIRLKLGSELVDPSHKTTGAAVRRIAPTQSVAVEDDDPAHHAPIIDTRFATPLRKIRSKPSRTLICQNVKVAHSLSPLETTFKLSERRARKILGCRHMTLRCNASPG